MKWCFDIFSLLKHLEKIICVPYIREYLSYKICWILTDLLFKSGRKTMHTYKCKIPPTHEVYKWKLSPLKPHDLHMFKFIIILHCIFTMGEAHGWGGTPKMWGWTQLSPHPRPFIWKCCHPWALSYTCFIYNQIWLNIFLDDCHLSPSQNC